MPLSGKPVKYLRKRRFESLLFSSLILLAIGYVLVIHFRDHLAIQELPFLCVAGFAALLSNVLMAGAYHRELRRRSS